MQSCQKHPKYLGKKKPTNTCSDCLRLYLIVKGSPRLPIKPTKVFKNKKKYSRKRDKKHMKKEEAIKMVKSYRSLDGVRVKFETPSKRTEPYSLVVKIEGTKKETEYEVPRGELRKYKDNEFAVFVQKCLDDFRKQNC